MSSHSHVVIPDPPQSLPARLQAAGLQFTYPGTDFSLHLPELTLAPGQTVLLSGPSGIGKTTLLRLLCGLLLCVSFAMSTLDCRFRGGMRVGSLVTIEFLAQT